MDKNTISEILKFDFLKIEVIDLYLTHCFNFIGKGFAFLKI